MAEMIPVIFCVCFAIVFGPDILRVIVRVGQRLFA